MQLPMSKTGSAIQTSLSSLNTLPLSSLLSASIVKTTCQDLPFVPQVVPCGAKRLQKKSEKVDFWFWNLSFPKGLKFI